MEPVSAELIDRAKNGERAALEEIVRRVQDRVYGLALRMLFLPADAEDATQEIMIKVITRLGSFRGESRFETWVWRVAANHLLTARKSRAERRELTFEFFTEQIDRAVADDWDEGTAEPVQNLMVEEIRLECLNGLFLCLDREQRLAYILGEVYDLPGPQAALVFDISPEAFRQRLSRARARLRNWCSKNCGLINPDNPCRCAKVAHYDLEQGIVRPDKMFFAPHPSRSPADQVTLSKLPEMDEMSRLATLFRCQPDYISPTDFVTDIKAVLKA
jgi:RNA polymerase sigma factor (sigma-70 family)